MLDELATTRAALRDHVAHLFELSETQKLIVRFEDETSLRRRDDLGSALHGQDGDVTLLQTALPEWASNERSVFADE